MKHKRWFIGALILLIGFGGIAIAQQDMMPGQMPGQQPGMMQPQSPTSAIDQRFQMANQWLNQNNLSITKSPEQAFIGDYILVVAEGLPLKTATSSTQKRLTAERAATVIAYRQLTEFIEGFALVGDTLVKDAELQYDVIRVAVPGFVKGAQIVYKEYNQQEESALVIVKVGMTGPQSFATSVYKKMFVTDKKMDPQFVKAIHEVDGKPAPNFKAAVVPVEAHDGLIIDATEQNFRPALINRVFTPKGELLYDPSKISQKVLVEQGCGEYTNSVDKAKAALGTRGVNNPLIIKAIGTVSPSDIQVSDDDAVTIFSANQKKGFFASAKVAFVLK